MPTYQQSHRLLVICYASFNGLLVLAMIIGVIVPAWRIPSNLSFYSLIVSTLLMSLISFLSRRGIRRRLHAERGLVCPSCEYSLTDTIEPGPCPECGQEFRIKKVRDHWEELNLFRARDE